MKFKKNLITYIIAAFLTIGMVNSISLTTFAHEDHHKFKDEYEKLDIKTKQKVDDILSSLKTDLVALGVEVPKHKGKHHLFENLDDKTKQEVKKVMQDLKAGKLTKEEADTKLRELGIELPKHPMRESYEKLDKESKAKVKARIVEAKSEFEKIGVTFPEKYEYLIK